MKKYKPSVISTIAFGVVIVLILIGIAMLLSSCAAVPGEQPHNVKSGYLRDTLYAVFETYDARHARVFLTHDETAYCVADQALIEKANSILRAWDGEVMLHIRDLKYGDQDWMKIYKSGCNPNSDQTVNSDGTVSHTDEVFFLVTEIEAVPARTCPTGGQ